MAQERTRSLARVAMNRIRQDHGLSLLTALAMAAFVVLVYVVVVIGIGALLGRTGSPSVWLSVLATAIVAIAFEPARRGVRRWFSRALGHDRLSPYQVLARFPATVTGAYPAEELPARMAKVLAEGTGTARAEVWLVVHGHLELAASWPAQQSVPPSGPVGATDPTPSANSTNQTNPTNQTDQTDQTNPTMEISACAATAPRLGIERPGETPVVVVEGLRHSLAVRERGELLGALTVVVRDGQTLSTVEERLFAGLAAQSGLMLRVAGLRAELEQQLAQLERRTDELRKARRDLVARQDAARQRLERNIHDGAQQEVIALLVNLRLAQTLLTRSPERGVRLLSEQAAAARSTIDTLTALSGGLYPRLLTVDGPVAALRAAVASGPIPVHLTSSPVPRCEPAVEAAVYFCCLEAVQNATKHSGAARIEIDICGRFDTSGTGHIDLTVTDDGRGFDVDCPTGNGLANIRDRIESVRGKVSITSVTGEGTTVRATVPTVAPDRPADPAQSGPRFTARATTAATVGG
jgi:signal transduction histidine kinase